MKKVFNKKVNTGITLIALVITIVVLIILATVVINLSLGDNGIFNRAREAKEQYQNAEDKEQTDIAKATNEMDSYVDGNRGTVTISQEEYENLRKKGTWKLLAETTNTTDTEYTVDDITQFSSLILIIYNYVGDIVASTQTNYDLFKNIDSSLGLYTNYNNGTSYVGVARYVNDTKIKLKRLNTNTGKICFYGIY